MNQTLQDIIRHARIVDSSFVEKLKQVNTLINELMNHFEGERENSGRNYEPELSSRKVELEEHEPSELSSQKLESEDSDSDELESRKLESEPVSEHSESERELSVDRESLSAIIEHSDGSIISDTNSGSEHRNLDSPHLQDPELEPLILKREHSFVHKRRKSVSFDTIKSPDSVGSNSSGSNNTPKKKYVSDKKKSRRNLFGKKKGK